MILYPAIDLKGGRCVRLVRGALDTETVFSDDPAETARQFMKQGAAWLHLVDLDGAFQGKPANAAAVRAILAAVDLPCQLGGGIRTRATIDAWLEAGIARVILGTIAVEDPALVEAAARAYPGKIAVAIDARQGVVVTRGWATPTAVQAADLARRYEDAGVGALIYTDVDRDGTMTGPNVRVTEALARSVTIPVIASGGIARLEDLLALAATGVVAGAIVGRALYEGAIDLTEALAALRR